VSNKKTASVLTLLVSVILIIFLYPRLQHPAALQTLIIHLGWKGIVLDLLILTLQMLFPFIPFALLAGINTLLFGWLPGFLISLTGSVLGSSVGFGLARSLGQEWAKPRLAKLGKWGNLPEAKSFYLIMLARLIPILPAAAVNYAAGISPMKFPTFLLATILGKIPMIAWESWIGHDFWRLVHHPWRFALALVLGAVVFSVAWMGWRILESKEKVNE